MKCLNCDNKAIGRSKYCSDKCKQAAYRNRTEATTVTSPTVTTVTDKPEQPTGTTTDACGNVHQIYFAGRCSDFELLKAWHAGKGSVYQQVLGELARKYSVINGYLDKHYKLTVQGRR